MHSVGDRVLERIRQACPGALHQDLASDIGMTPDAFSRALSGKRQFSSLELVRVAERLNADLHWLITGGPDPNRLVVAARHDFDFESGRRDVPGRHGDEQVIGDIALAYRQAYPEPAVCTALSGDAQKIRDQLEPNFVRPLADRLDAHLGVDVVRVAGLSTAYSFTIGGRRVIAIAATGNWFWENWSMAHELGHLALDHHDDELSADLTADHEMAANRFAAELLLPAADLRELEWDTMSDQILAAIVWEWGVSVDALARRLNALLGYVPECVQKWAPHPTQRLLRRHLALNSEIDEITRRMDDASQRRFPLHLQEAHLARIAAGTLGKGTLAWMLGIDADALDVDTPDLPEASADELTAALGL